MVNRSGVYNNYVNSKQICFLPIHYQSIRFPLDDGPDEGAGTEVRRPSSLEYPRDEEGQVFGPEGVGKASGCDKPSLEEVKGGGVDRAKGP